MYPRDAPPISPSAPSDLVRAPLHPLSLRRKIQGAPVETLPVDVSGLEAIYVGAADIARGKVGSLRNPAYRKKYEDAYRLDLKRYGGELSLEHANGLLEKRKKAPELLLRRWKQHGHHTPLSKEVALHIAPWMLPPVGVDGHVEIDNALELGGIAEFLYAERLPSIRLWIHFKEYVVAVVPDGIADDYVYEFKATTLTGRDVEEVRDQAIRQAQLYAYAFKRPNIKVQIAHFELSRHTYPLKVRDLPKPEIATIFRPASEDEALRILCDFDLAFRGLKRQG